MTTVGITEEIGHWIVFLFTIVSGIYVGIYSIEHVKDPDHMILAGCIGIIIGALIPIIYKKMDKRYLNT